ncbi:STAS domain-containing protein [Paramaledivibacter caminithermalis]|uniref:Anti-sigma factor antagonist n=1 Tax=Paramaledivibacter caminithermalis (strain DSM 15212 / CIP 107654 / DViRD3) TaxID=1121301 RepID=A0A1M6P8T4_PARC5|nr:STAS domain-containing protein [Paramaledivibacter caminithermalis]SHK04338.1 anti-sigma B factor antagonist [Paramaledivibacter caminithermalis DSM 15212]
MLVETLTQDNIKFINVFGEISFENHSEFKESILRNILGEESIIIFNMEKVTYLNSMSLGIIVKAYSESKKQGKKFVLCSLQDNIKKLFSITKLDKIISIYEDREEAVKLFKG